MDELQRFRGVLDDSSEGKFVGFCMDADDTRIIAVGWLEMPEKGELGQCSI